MEPRDLSRLEATALDLLVDGPSSVAAMYGSAVRLLALSEALESRSLVEALETLRASGLVSAWLAVDEDEPRIPSPWEVEEAVKQYEKAELGKASLEDLAVDDVGLWYEITPVGRQLWNAAYQRDDPPRWRVEELLVEGLVRVYAEDRATAENVLRDWSSSHAWGGIDLKRAVVRENVAFVLANGGRVTGVEITCPLAAAE